jgi:hypothetical protein
MEILVREFSVAGLLSSHEYRFALISNEDIFPHLQKEMIFSIITSLFFAINKLSSTYKHSLFCSELFSGVINKGVKCFSKLSGKSLCFHHQGLLSTDNTLYMIVFSLRRNSKSHFNGKNCEVFIIVLMGIFRVIILGKIR